MYESKKCNFTSSKKRLNVGNQGANLGFLAFIQHKSKFMSGFKKKFDTFSFVEIAESVAAEALLEIIIIFHNGTSQHGC